MHAEPLQRHEMDERHRRARAKRAPGGISAPPGPARKNLSTILALGDEEFIQFRGRAYGVPPIPLKAGEQLLDSYLAATAAARKLALAAIAREPDEAARADYFAALRALQRQLWALSREPSRWRRWLRRFGLRPNPYRVATEAELLEMAHFFYRRRTRSRGPLRPMPASRARRISSMIS